MYINVWICLNISPENGSIRYGYCCTICVYISRYSVIVAAQATKSECF